MSRVRLIVQYDGTSFAGWQVQPGARTVQGVLEEAVSRILGGERVRVSAAGRTDAGVHARGQVVSFSSLTERPIKAWVQGLNRMLPSDVAVLEAAKVTEEFDPRRWSHGKRYVYRIWNGPTRAPLFARYAWEIATPLDARLMAESARALVGEHDFSSFQAAGCAAKTTVRVVESLEVEGAGGGEIAIDVRASAFLRHMVRNIAGTLVEVGLGRREPESVREVLEAKDRRMAGRTAPGRGLTLEEVYYGSEPPRRRRMSAVVELDRSEES